jgi:hypothetical protein
VEGAYRRPGPAVATILQNADARSFDSRQVWLTIGLRGPPDCRRLSETYLQRGAFLSVETQLLNASIGIEPAFQLEDPQTLELREGPQPQTSTFANSLVCGSCPNFASLERMTDDVW